MSFPRLLIQQRKKISIKRELLLFVRAIVLIELLVCHTAARIYCEKHANNTENTELNQMSTTFKKNEWKFTRTISRLHLLGKLLLAKSTVDNINRFPMNGNISVTANEMHV